MMDAVAFGEAICKLRNDLSLSKSQLATLGGVSIQYITTLEKGRMKDPFSNTTVIGICKQLQDMIDSKKQIRPKWLNEFLRRQYFDENEKMEVDKYQLDLIYKKLNAMEQEIKELKTMLSLAI